MDQLPSDPTFTGYLPAAVTVAPGSVAPRKRYARSVTIASAAGSVTVRSGAISSSTAGVVVAKVVVVSGVVVAVVDSCRGVVLDVDWATGGSEVMAVVVEPGMAAVNAGGPTAEVLVAAD
jgi:hypothetical protein